MTGRRRTTIFCKQEHNYTQPLDKPLTQMDTYYLNYWAILVSALSTFLIGGLWYSPAVFGKAWMRENGFREEDMQGANMVKIFGLAFFLALISAINLAMFLGPQADVAFGAGAGFAAG